MGLVLGWLKGMKTENSHPEKHYTIFGPCLILKCWRPGTFLLFYFFLWCIHVFSDVHDCRHHIYVEYLQGFLSYTTKNNFCPQTLCRLKHVSPSHMCNSGCGPFSYMHLFLMASFLPSTCPSVCKTPMHYMPVLFVALLLGYEKWKDDSGVILIKKFGRRVEIIMF